MEYHIEEWGCTQTWMISINVYHPVEDHSFEGGLYPSVPDWTRLNIDQYRDMEKISILRPYHQQYIAGWEARLQHTIKVSQSDFICFIKPLSVEVRETAVKW